MADKKISQLTDGTSLQSGDAVVIARSGDNYKVDPTQFGSSIDVTGTVTADGLTVDGEVSVVKAAGYNQVHLGGDRTDTARAGRIMKNWDAPYDMRIRSSSSVGDTPLYFETGSSGTRMQIASNGDISFYENTGTTPKFFWDASAESLGIGTTIPVYSIHSAGANPRIVAVSSSATSYSSLEARNDTNGTIAIISRGSTATGTVLGQPNANGAQLYSISQDYFALGTFQANPLIFGTSNSERMRIDSSGNVGIGTSSPYAKTVVALAPTVAATTVNETADFADQFVIANSGTSTNGHRLPLIFNLGGDAANNISAGIVALREASGWNTALSFWTNNITAGAEGSDAIQEKMRIDSSGNVGIGTSSPAGITSGITTLAISDEGAKTTGDKTGALAFITNDGSFTGTYSDGVTAEISSVSETSVGGAYGLAFATATTSGSNRAERMRIDSAGNVGIGTASPADVLDVRGNSGADKGVNIKNDGSGRAVINLDAGGTSTSFLRYKNQGTITGEIESSSSIPLRFSYGASSTEAMRIDSSGNLLVGKTATASTAVGAEVRPEGRIFGTTDSGFILLLNRTNTDGDIAVFRKDGTTVGMIQSRAGLVSNIILDPRTPTSIAGAGLGTSSAAICPADTSGLTDAKNDLGINTNRFKDLYLSGGVYLGGTGAANLLDDYEEGTFTPTTDSDATGVLVAAEGYYTKVGRLVTAEIIVQVGTNFTSNGIGGLPFTVENLASASSVGQNTVALTSATPSEPVFVAASEGTTKVFLYLGSTGSNHNPNTTQNIYRILLSYMAA